MLGGKDDILRTKHTKSLQSSTKLRKFVPTVDVATRTQGGLNRELTRETSHGK